MISAKNIYKSFGTVDVLKGASLDISTPEIAAILGKSGSGKSTFLQIIGTLDQADKGTVNLLGNDIAKLNKNQLAELRNEHIGFIFQFHHLLAEFTALENVCIPYYIANKSKVDAERRGKELLDFLGLTHRLTHKPKELSGGEQQRVAVARAMMNNPDIIFADEPTGNLDGKSSQNLLDIFKQLHTEFEKTIIMVTHNEDLAKQCHTTYHMTDGILTHHD